jgi:hypothetical protein
MKQTAVEWYAKQMQLKEQFTQEEFNDITNQAIEMEEKLQLELVHKFVFDYTYNYRGNKTIYEYVDEWYEEYKRIEEKHKNK